MNNKPNTRTFVKNLTVGDRFVLDGTDTVYVADKVTTVDNMTRVDYHIKSETALNRFSFSKVNLTCVSVYK